jgi:signal peptidase I
VEAGKMGQPFKNFKDSRSYHSLVALYLIFIVFVIFFSSGIGPIYSLTNVSGSMSPTIGLGSIVLVVEQDSYEVGDIISYYSEIGGQEFIVTHRIHNIGGNAYVTKGDANKVVDRDVVRPRLVIGKAVAIIPYLGFVIAFAKSLPGTLLIIILPAILIIRTELNRIGWLKGKRSQV